MGINVFPAPSAAGKTRKIETLLSGSSYSVPAGVNYLNVTLFGGGGGGGAGDSQLTPQSGHSGQVVSSTLSTTPLATISYGIGAGGTAGISGNRGGTGGTTTFTGATSAVGGAGGAGVTNGTTALGATGTNAGGGNNYGGGAGTFNTGGGAGGTGKIQIEYWV